MSWRRFVNPVTKSRDTGRINAHESASSPERGGETCENGEDEPPVPPAKKRKLVIDQGLDVLSKTLEISTDQDEMRLTKTLRLALASSDTRLAELIVPGHWWGDRFQHVDSKPFKALRTKGCWIPELEKDKLSPKLLLTLRNMLRRHLGSAGAGVGVHDQNGARLRCMVF